ncbi:ankyrin repeat domain-containing protein [Streptomyces sp. NPDC002054]|uniref:ankyrin repeat domain-containing protein n=1 Tax=Streptomyces sp. NPDC002054 TaxID=3154663 RepID=UPI0033228DA8
MTTLKAIVDRGETQQRQRAAWRTLKAEIAATVRQRSRTAGDDPGMDITDQLTRAAENGDAAAVAWLLGVGAGVDARNSVRRIALELAVSAGHAETVRLLLASGADPCRPAGEYEELTPLLLAAMLPNAEVVKALLAAGASLGAQGLVDYVPLVVAATSGEQGYPQIVVLFLEHGADINAVMRGRTALELAIGGGKVQMARWLLGRGAKPTRYALSLAYHQARQSPEAVGRYAVVINALHAARLTE